MKALINFCASFSRTTIFIFIFSTITNMSFSQIVFWGTSGNSISSSDYIGTNNNQDFSIKTNGNLAVKVKANGNFLLKSMEGSGSGLVLFDNNGKLNPLIFSGDVNQVLLGNGTFGVAPNLWSVGSGSKIYYNGGKVGIGTSSPNFKLDVDGDMRVTQDFYLQGAMIISEKIETPKQMKAGSVIADSIIMDSTKAFYGFSNFKGDVKLQAKLNVNGDVLIIGNTDISGSLTTNTLINNTFASNKINVSRIAPAFGDTIIRFGDSTMYINTGINRIYASSTGFYKGIGIGQGSAAAGSNSCAIGYNTRVSAGIPNAVAIGSGSSTSNFFHNIPNSLGIGFNSDIPTLYVSSSSGSGTTGSVGIGTTYIPSAYKLAVNGNIITEEVFVLLRANWPDYVFDKKYELRSIEELKNFVNTNKHLPNIPSAKEVENEKAYGLGDLQVKILEKIEEQTLYIIQINDRLSFLEEENKKLKSQLKKN